MKPYIHALALSVAMLPSIALCADDPPAAGDKTVAEQAKEAGAAVARDAKAVGKAVKEDAVKVGHAVKKGAVKVGEAAKEGAVEVAHGAKHGAQKVKAVVTRDKTPEAVPATAPAAPVAADPH